MDKYCEDNCIFKNNFICKKYNKKLSVTRLFWLGKTEDKPKKLKECITGAIVKGCKICSNYKCEETGG